MCAVFVMNQGTQQMIGIAYQLWKLIVLIEPIGEASCACMAGWFDRPRVYADLGRQRPRFRRHAWHDYPI